MKSRDAYAVEVNAYATWIARRADSPAEGERYRQQAWRDYDVAEAYERFRARQKRAEEENDLILRTVGAITQDMKSLAEEIDVTKSEIHKRGRLQRAEHASTRAAVEHVAANTTKLAQALVPIEPAPEPVVEKSAEPAPVKRLIKRKIVHRDEKNRITHVDETMVEVEP